MQLEQLLPRVDAVIWVTDPEKYADAVLHDDFLRAWMVRLDSQANEQQADINVGSDDYIRSVPVEFIDETSLLGGVATLVTSSLMVGSHNVTANYGGAFSVDIMSSTTEVQMAAFSSTGLERSEVAITARHRARSRVLARVSRSCRDVRAGR